MLNLSFSGHFWPLLATSGHKTVLAMSYLCDAFERERGRSRGMAMANEAAARRNNIQNTAMRPAWSEPPLVFV